MAFDFNGNHRSAAAPNSSARRDIDYSAANDAAGFSDAGSSGFGGRRDLPNGFGGQSAGTQTSFAEAPGKQAGFQNRPTGFSDRPAQNGTRSDLSGRPAGPAPRPPAKRPAAPRGRAGGYCSIPWRIIFPVIVLAIAVILCVVYRDAITEFLAQVLAWVIVILVIICLIKWLIFGGRRRR